MTSGHATKADCDICRGCGVIHLPIYRRAEFFDVNSSPVAGEISRSYPCPECANIIPQDRVAIVHHNSHIDSQIEGYPDVMRSVKRDMVCGLAVDLLDSGFIRFERGQTDYRLRIPMRATVGVMSLKHVATLEQRIVDRQEELACEVISEAAKQIRIWGSHYSGDEGKISKGQAVDSVNAALTQVLARRSSRKAV